jgi:hypothetical protein
MPATDEPKFLNHVTGFSWATKPRDGDGYAKVSVGGESFWLRDCEEVDATTFMGVIDNELVCTDTHGLLLDDVVFFTPNWPDAEHRVMVDAAE